MLYIRSQLEIGLDAITPKGHRMTKEDIVIDPEKNQSHLRDGTSENCETPARISGYNELCREVYLIMKNVVMLPSPLYLK